MALNLIRVPTDEGPMLIGLTNVLAVFPHKDDGNKSTIVFVEGPVAEITVNCSMKEIESLANRRPPDGF